jgi:hypothetical protein
MSYFSTFEKKKRKEEEEEEEEEVEREIVRENFGKIVLHSNSLTTSVITQRFHSRTHSVSLKKIEKRILQLLLIKPIQ